MPERDPVSTWAATHRAYRYCGDSDGAAAGYQHDGGQQPHADTAGQSEFAAAGPVS
jgi:hypothetical protein